MSGTSPSGPRPRTWVPGPPSTPAAQTCPRPARRHAQVTRGRVSRANGKMCNCRAHSGERNRRAAPRARSARARSARTVSVKKVLKESSSACTPSGIWPSARRGGRQRRAHSGARANDILPCRAAAAAARARERQRAPLSRAARTRLDAMLQAEELPARVPYLDARLANVNVDNLTHRNGLEARRRTTSARRARAQSHANEAARHYLLSPLRARGRDGSSGGGRGGGAMR